MKSVWEQFTALPPDIRATYLRGRGVMPMQQLYSHDLSPERRELIERKRNEMRQRWLTGDLMEGQYHG